MWCECYHILLPTHIPRSLFSAHVFEAKPFYHEISFACGDDVLPVDWVYSTGLHSWLISECCYQCTSTRRSACDQIRKHCSDMPTRQTSQVTKLYHAMGRYSSDAHSIQCPITNSRLMPFTIYAYGCLGGMIYMPYFHRTSYECAYDTHDLVMQVIQC